MSTNDQSVGATVGRMAPSPTGGLHLGHARTFLIVWLTVRKALGRLILRIEDLDRTRVRAEALESCLADLAWLGLAWDEGPDRGGPSAPYVQSQRLTLYGDALERLKDRELVYPCTCSRADILRASNAPHADEEGPVYPGTCAHRTVEDAKALGRLPFAWRFRVPTQPISWDDLALGNRALDLTRLGGDFVVWRNTFGPSYQLAVVVDDALMGVNQVIRGDDLVPSTPRQIVLYQALGWPPPEFGHVPLVNAPDGRRLAKRDGSIKLAALRDRTIAPERIIGFLMRSLDVHGVPHDCRPADALDSFTLDAVPREPWTLPADWIERLERPLD